MANLGLIDFKIGLYIKGNVTAGQKKFEVHIYQFAQNGHQLAQNRPDVTLATWTLFGLFFFIENFKIIIKKLNTLINGK